MDWRQRAHRRRSFTVPGHAHELTFTCYRRFAFLNAERTWQWLADEIDKARQELDFGLLEMIAAKDQATPGQS